MASSASRNVWPLLRTTYRSAPACAASGFGWIRPGRDRPPDTSRRRRPLRSSSSWIGSFGRTLAIHGLLPGSPNRIRLLVAHVVLGDRRVVLDRQFAAEVVVPFVGEPLQARVGVGLDLRVPRLAGAADAQKRRREGVVDRAWQPRPLARDRELDLSRGTQCPLAGAPRELNRLPRLALSRRCTGQSRMSCLRSAPSPSFPAAPRAGRRSA